MRFDHISTYRVHTNVVLQIRLLVLKHFRSLEFRTLMRHPFGHFPRTMVVAPQKLEKIRKNQNIFLLNECDIIKM